MSGYDGYGVIVGVGSGLGLGSSVVVVFVVLFSSVVEGCVVGTVVTVLSGTQFTEL